MSQPDAPPAKPLYFKSRRRSSAFSGLSSAFIPRSFKICEVSINLLINPPSERCPVVELHDSAVDVKHLLNVLYNPLLFSEKTVTLSFVAAIVRMGPKYEFKELLAAALQRLTDENPTTLDEYENLTNEDGISYTSTRIIHYRNMSFDVITLARENGLLTVLPCAYLRAILYTNLEQLLDGFYRANKPLITLCFEEQRICISGQQKTIEAQWTHRDLWDWLNSDLCADSCTDKDSCVQKKKLLFRNLVLKGYPLVPFRLGPDHSLRLCVACQRHHANIIAQGRKKLWEDLPSFFDLPPWAELRNDL
ncbi:BTB domain-containing protein [Mycena venus]|uniref:BTB domain-containing protein n=1 Tax=Mycena venus TaxID=2733690 RepID=A0A8H6WU39_9AGAR|nr:BTB domain-containing protein [Mycena venus]